MSSMMDQVYETKHYIIKIKESGSGYVLFNKTTNAYEREVDTFPQAVSQARALSQLMEEITNESPH